MHITLFPVRQATEIARTFVRHRLLNLHMTEEMVYNGCLIATELAANVVKHVPYAETFHLYVSPNGRATWIEVWDPSPARPVVRENPEGECGRGLMIVTALAKSWYCDLLPPERGGGKIVAALL